jgi:transposase
MPRKLQLRPLTPEEAQKLQQVSRSRTAPQRAVERARMVLLVAAGQRAQAVAEQVGRTVATVYYQVRQFNARGLDFLNDVRREGRPWVYDQQQRGQIVQAAKTNPQDLQLGFGRWTLDLLTEYVNGTLNIPISRTQLGAVLHQEGLKWYQEKTYFTESPDPQFVEKRGLS